MTEGHVVIGRLAFHEAYEAVQLLVPFGEGPVVLDPDARWPDEVRVLAVAHKGRAKLRGGRRLASVQLLATGSAHVWIVRREAAEAIAALGDPGDVRLVPAALADAEGVIEDGWALLDVQAVAPLDRDAAAFTPTTPGAPHASLVASIERVAFRSPVPPLFRVAEAPQLLVGTRAVLTRMQAILGPWVVALEPPYDAPPAIAGLPCAPLRGGGLAREPVGGASAPIPTDEAKGRRAFDALEALRRGESGAASRAHACASPITAYLLARLVDRGPADDTRAGAAAHPRYATMYARDVDAAPHSVTREAALRDRYAAHVYLAEVERVPSDAFVRVLGTENVAAMQEEIPAMRALRSPTPPRFPAPTAAARETKPRRRV